MKIFWVLKKTFGAALQPMQSSLCCLHAGWCRYLFTCSPSAVTAEQAWTCHMRSRIVCRLRLSASSDTDMAVIRSCLLAMTNSGTPASTSSSSNSVSSWRNQDRRVVNNLWAPAEPELNNIGFGLNSWWLHWVCTLVSLNNHQSQSTHLTVTLLLKKRKCKLHLTRLVSSNLFLSELSIT